MHYQNHVCKPNLFESYFPENLRITSLSVFCSWHWFAESVFVFASFHLCSLVLPRWRLPAARLCLAVNIPRNLGSSSTRQMASLSQFFKMCRLTQGCVWPWSRGWIARLHQNNGIEERHCKPIHRMTPLLALSQITVTHLWLKFLPTALYKMSDYFLSVETGYSQSLFFSSI